MTANQPEFPTPEQRRVLWQAITIAAVLFLVIIGVSLIAGLISFASMLTAVLVPLSIGAIIAILFYPVVGFITSKISVSRQVVIIGLLTVTTLIAIGVIIALIVAGISFIANIPDLINELDALVSDRLTQQPELVEEFQSLTETLKQYAPQIVATISEFLFSAISNTVSIIGAVVGFVFIPLYAYYLLINYERIKERWALYIPLTQSAFRNEIELVVGQISEYIVTFFRGQITIAMIIGTFISVCLFVLGFDYALLIGIFAGFAGIIPYLGSILAIIPGVTMAFIQSGGNWGYVLLVALVFIAGSQLESLVVSPKIMSNRTGLHPMVVIISMLVWGIILDGVLGFILAVPLTATLKVLLNRYFWKLSDEELGLVSPTQNNIEDS